MIFQSFEIRSYKSCLKTKLQLQPNLTALIGINGVGKSNILTGFTLLKKILNFNNRFGQRELSNKCKLIVTLLYEEKPVILTINAKYETDSRNVDKILPINLSWNFTSHFSKFPVNLNIPLELFSKDAELYSDRYLQYSFHRLNSDSWSNIERHYKEAFIIATEIITSLLKITYYSASQFSDPSNCSVSFEIEDNKIIRTVRVGPHNQFIFDLYNSHLRNDSIYKKYLSLINKSGLGLIDTIEFIEVGMPSTSFEIQSGGKIKVITKERKLLVPQFKIDNNVLSPNQLSEGTFKTLALVFYILTDKSSILLVEEPEVGIHHGLLNSVITLIKDQSRRKQIVISTHSDFVLDQLDPGNIVLVRKEPNKGTTAKPLNRHLKSNDYRALKSYLEESGNLGEYWKEGGINE